jgi:ABC-type xylose transport system permease subunit
MGEVLKTISLGVVVGHTMVSHSMLVPEVSIPPNMVTLTGMVEGVIQGLCVITLDLCMEVPPCLDTPKWVPPIWVEWVVTIWVAPVKVTFTVFSETYMEI